MDEALTALLEASALEAARKGKGPYVGAAAPSVEEEPEGSGGVAPTQVAMEVVEDAGAEVA